MAKLKIKKECMRRLPEFGFIENELGMYILEIKNDRFDLQQIEVNPDGIIYFAYRFNGEHTLPVSSSNKLDVIYDLINAEMVEKEG